MKIKSLLALAVLAAAGSAQAATILGPAQSLSALLQTSDTDPGIKVGDKLFHNFTYAGTGDMPAASGVNVVPISDADGNFGIRFTGGFQDAAGGGASDALISYTVDVQDPNFVISDAHLQGDPVVVGTGSMSVVESWVPDAGDTKISISDIKPGDTSLIAGVDFDPLTFTTIHAQKDILAQATGDTSVVTMTFVDQTYSQIPSVRVPEPASLGLLAVGGIALMMRRRKA